MKKINKLLSVILALIMIISIIPMSGITAFAEDSVVSGTCGDNLTWTFNESTGNLTISGTGAMKNYSSSNRPWESYEDSIKTVVINDTITTIGDYAFDDCDSLTSVTIGDSVTTIGSRAFDDCNSLTSVTIPDSVTTIGDYAFYNCDSLTSVTIPDSVTTIGSSAFYSCDSLTNITVDINNQYYSSDEYGVLFNKDKTTLIQYPIGNTRAYYAISDSVTTIDAYAFYSCDSLTSVTIPDSVTTIGNYTFRYCYSLTSVIVDSNNKYYSSDEYGVLFNKDKTTLIQYPIGNTRAYYAISDSVTTIDANAFYSCNSLEEVTIGDSVTTIGNYAFANCTNLEIVIIGDSVTTIGNYAFAYCTNLEIVTIGDSVTTIGDRAFYSCSSLTSVTIGNSVTTIGNYAFAYCTNLSTIVDSYYRWDDVVIPDSVTSLGTGAFRDCTSLTSVKLGSGITIINSGTFSGCSNLNVVIIAGNVTTINFSAFRNCYNISEFYYFGDDWNSVLIRSGNESLDDVIVQDHYHEMDYEYREPSCTENIYITYHCRFCSYEYTEIEYATGHSYYVEDMKKPTCTEQGYTMYECWRCGDSYDDNYVDATGHNHISEITTPATHLTEGVETFVCSLCGDEYTKAIEKLPDHRYEAVTTEPTCTEQGYTTYTCECGDSYDDNYVGAMGHIYEELIMKLPTCYARGTKKFICHECGNSYQEDIAMIEHTPKDAVEENYVAPTCTTAGSKDVVVYCSVCNAEVSRETETISALGHTPKDAVEENYVAPNCTTAGSKDIVVYCSVCNEEISRNTESIAALGHTAGEWETVLEPTYEADGKKVKKCTVCGDVVEEEVIPMLVKVTVTDEDTGVSMEFDEGEYNGEVEIIVEESFDGTAFNVIDTMLDATQSFVYDITMTVDGEVTQPNGKVTIKIPLPAGYDPARSFVYHVDTETGKVEKMPARYEDGYLVFETTHFSYYAVVEEANNEYNYSFSIQNPSRTEIRNKDGIILHANIDGTAPNGSYVKWESNNSNFDKSADGSNLKIIAKNKGYTTFTAILCDADGNELARDSVEMYSKSGFFDKIGGFFRSLFGTTKTYDY